MYTITIEYTLSHTKTVLPTTAKPNYKYTLSSKANPPPAVSKERDQKQCKVNAIYIHWMTAQIPLKEENDSFGSTMPFLLTRLLPDQENERRTSLSINANIDNRTKRAISDPSLLKLGFSPAIK